MPSKVRRWGDRRREARRDAAVAAMEAAGTGTRTSRPAHGRQATHGDEGPGPQAAPQTFRGLSPTSPSRCDAGSPGNGAWRR